MDLDEIRALLAVAEHGSFVSAARATRLTRSTLRRRVDELEARIGAPLLDRTASGAKLTPTGEVVVREGRLVAEHARAMLGAARTLRDQDAEPLVVVVQQGVPAELAASALAMLAPLFVGATIDLEYSSNPRASLVEDADLVIGAFGSTPEGPWQAIALREMDEHLFASEEYLSRHGVPQTLEDVARHPIALWRSPESPRATLPLRAGGVLEVAPSLVTSDVHLLHLLASAGQMLAYAPDGGITPATSAPARLRPVLPELVGRRTAMWLLAPREAAATPRVRSLVDTIRALLASAAT